MNLTVDEITRTVTGKRSLQECDTEELKQITQQNPYFGPASLLLTKKLKQEDVSAWEELAHKTSLYFHNPVWFDYVLNNTVIQENKITEQEIKPVYPAQVQETPVTHEEVVEQNTETIEEAPAAESPVDIENNDEDEIPPDENTTDEMPIKLPEFKFEPVDTEKAELSFEPYHTVDYFASQGINVKDDEKPKSQFDRQLKSFTEWLKVLKKVPATEIASTVSTQDESNVEKMAAISIDDREVVTETMAEVWEKQGNTKKATEVYHKLSLLNPSKSSYFAAKIEQLKRL